jgi:hypothetical protein
MSKKKRSESLEIISTYSNEITHIHICMKLHVYEIGKTQIFNVFLKGHKDSKDIEKNKEIYFSFDIL